MPRLAFLCSVTTRPALVLKGLQDFLKFIIREGGKKDQKAEIKFSLDDKKK